MNKGHDKGHKGQMSDRDVMKLAFEYIYDCDNKDPLVETLRQALERPQTPDDLLRQSEREGWRYAKECEAEVKRLRQALDHVPDTTKMIEPDMGIDRGAWDDVPDATKWVDELRGGDETEQEPVACKHNRYSVDVHEQTGTCYDCGADGRMRFVVDDTAPPKQPEQEPVAYITGEYKGYFTIEQTNKSFVLTQGMNLYIAPPKRKWQGLTDEDIAEGAKQSWVDKQAFESAVWWAEAKLREKNGF